MVRTTGLPQVALDRIARASSSGVRTSLLSVPSAVSAHVVGLSPIGEVMGCIVTHIGWQGWAGCGYWGAGYGNGYGNYSRGNVGATTFGGFKPYVDAIRHGYDAALQRLSDEARLLGADGVIDVRITVNPLGKDNHEFVALGSAVRLGDERTGIGTIPKSLPVPFMADLPGADVAKLMMNGWIPTSIVYGIALAVRHDDWLTYTQLRNWQNAEVSGVTELANHVRHEARQVVTAQAGQKGAGGVLITGSTLRIWEQEPAEGHRDHLAEARMFGTGIVQFPRPRAKPTAKSLTFLPLR